MIKLLNGNCLDVLKELPENSIDSIVTDPPYGLNFMGKKWDYDVPTVDIWKECLRVLKPGGHLLAFAGTRTQHRMCVNIEDAGFEIRDMIAWVYGSGFPKSLDISKAIDKGAGAKRKVISEKKTNSGGMAHISKTNAEHGFRPSAYTGNSEDKSAANVIQITAPATEAAQQWEGWGTALKPALEPITVARKPFKGTVAQNVMEHGTGGINVDSCRISAGNEDFSNLKGRPLMKINNRRTDDESLNGAAQQEALKKLQDLGRWPANLIHDGSDEVVGLFPESSSATPRNRKPRQDRSQWRNGGAEYNNTTEYGDSGSAARFFYCAKASKKERGEGNTHPTVKPLKLMQYLCRLVTPAGGTLLDPFAGSGTTLLAAQSEGFDAIGIELDANYIKIAQSRLDNNG